MLHNRSNLKNFAVAGGLLGGTLIGFATFFPTKAIASALNPCPGIYYEEPFNSNRLVPPGCSPNAATQRVTQIEAQTPRALPSRTVPFTGTTPLQPPLPENRADAVAMVALTSGLFDVRLTNNTNTLVTYEVIGHTQRRYLQEGEEVLLQELPAPATITFVRQDDGFVEVLPVASSELGLLTVELDEDASPLDSNQGVLRIQADGQVFLN